MAERILINWAHDSKTNELHRKKVNGDEVVEDKVVAKYDPETQILTFPNQNALRLYKTGAMTHLSENEMLIKSFQLGNLKPDKPLSDKSVPPRPKKTLHEGDKTPAVVEWYLKHRWNEFCARYGYLGKYTGKVSYLVPVWEPRPVDGLPEYKGQQRTEKELVDAIVATRKTHLTFTPDECVDWDEEDPERETPDQGGPEVSSRGREEVEA